MYIVYMYIYTYIYSYIYIRPLSVPFPFYLWQTREHLPSMNSISILYQAPPFPLIEKRSPPPTVSRVWVAAVSAARRVSLRRALLVARVSNYPSGS